MNVLLASDHWHPVEGGIEQYLRGLAGALVSSAHEVQVLTSTYEGHADRETHFGVGVIRTNALTGAVGDPFHVLRNWPKLIPILREVSPDVVYANHHTSLATIVAAQHLGIPVVYGCHGWGLLCTHRLRLLRPDTSLCLNERTLVRCYECQRGVRQGLPSRVLIRRMATTITDAIVTFSRVRQYDKAEEIIASATLRIANSQLTAALLRYPETYAVHCAIDPQDYWPVDSKSLEDRLGLRSPYILMPGRVTAVKGHEWAIRALHELSPEFSMLIAGDTGPHDAPNTYFAQMRRLVTELGLDRRVIWSGPLALQEMRAAYSGALATVVPSVWLESFGYVTPESMACGTPVVVTSNCGSAELITNGINGFVVARLSSIAISDAVRQISSDRQEMGMRARADVLATASWNVLAPRIIGLLARAIDITQR